MFLPPNQTTEKMNINGVKINLPMPVSNNAMYMPAHGKIILTNAARSYYNELKNFFAREGGVEMIEGRLSVNVWIHEKDMRRRDINNLTKSLFDGLQKCGVYKDDSQIDETHIYRGEIVEDPYVCIEITVLEEFDMRVPLKAQRAAKKVEDKFNEKLDLLKNICKKTEIKKLEKKNG